MSSFLLQKKIYNLALTLILLSCFKAFATTPQISHSYNALIPIEKKTKIVLNIAKFSPYIKHSFTENLQLGTDVLGLATLRPNFSIKYRLFDSYHISFLSDVIFSSKHINSKRFRLTLLEAEKKDSGEIVPGWILKEKANYFLRFSPRLIYTHTLDKKLNINLGLMDIITLENYELSKISSSDTMVESHQLSLIMGADYSLSSNWAFKGIFLPSYLWIDVQNYLDKFSSLSIVDSQRKEFTYSISLNLIYLTLNTSEFEFGVSYSPPTHAGHLYDSITRSSTKIKYITQINLKYSWRF